MAIVFGKAITDETLRAMAGYQGRTITLNDKARMALVMKNSEDNEVTVRQQVEKFMEKAAGVGVATVCLIYNATGDSLTLDTYHDWSGHIGFTPYPPKIENGQWGVFLHVGGAATSDVHSVGAVVYRGKNSAGEDRDWMQAWANENPSKAYSEIPGVDHWTANDFWYAVDEQMRRSSSMKTEINEGGSSIVVIGNDHCAIFEATLMHPN